MTFQGRQNRAIDYSSSVSGGFDNTAGGSGITGSYSSVSGGARNTTWGDYSTIGGGYTTSAGGRYDWRAGDCCFCTDQVRPAE
jgi:hypothetical protein